MSAENLVAISPGQSNIALSQSQQDHAKLSQTFQQHVLYVLTKICSDVVCFILGCQAFMGISGALVVIHIFWLAV